MRLSVRKAWMTLAIVIPVCGGGSVRSESIRDRFLREYPTAVRAIEDRIKEYRVNVLPIPATRSNQKRESLVLTSSHGFHKVEAIFDQKYERVICSSNVSHFDLYKGHSDASFRVTSIGSDIADRSKFDQSYGRLFDLPLGSGFGKLIDLMNDPEFVLKGVTGIEGDAGKVRVEFELGPAPVSKGAFVLDPGNSWAVVSERRELGDMPRFEVGMDVEYGDRIDGFAYPHKVDFLLPGPGGRKDSFEYRDWKFGPTPIEEFRMSHYGIPESELKLESGNSSRFLLFGIISIFAILAVLYTTWKRPGRSNANLLR